MEAGSVYSRARKWEKKRNPVSLSFRRKQLCSLLGDPAGTCPTPSLLETTQLKQIMLVRNPTLRNPTLQLHTQNLSVEV